jgi:transposase
LKDLHKVMQAFLDEFEKEDPESLHLMLTDSAAEHTSEKLKVAGNIVFIFLSSNAPELNLIERFWRALKDRLSDYEP